MSGFLFPIFVQFWRFYWSILLPRSSTLMQNVFLLSHCLHCIELVNIKTIPQSLSLSRWLYWIDVAPYSPRVTDAKTLWPHAQELAIVSAASVGLPDMGNYPSLCFQSVIVPLTHTCCGFSCTREAYKDILTFECISGLSPHITACLYCYQGVIKQRTRDKQRLSVYQQPAQGAIIMCKRIVRCSHLRFTLTNSPTPKRQDSAMSFLCLKTKQWTRPDQFVHEGLRRASLSPQWGHTYKYLSFFTPMFLQNSV